MADLGVDLIEVSGGNYENTMVQGSNRGGALFIDYAAKAKQGLTAPILLTGGFRSLAGMTQAVANGKTDLVGLARAIALMPDLPHRAATGQFDAIDITRLSTGIRALDRRVGSYVGVSYYEMQMARLAQGKPVRRTKNAWVPLGYALRTQGPSFLTPRRA